MDLPTLSEPERLWWLVPVLPALFWWALPPRPRRVHWTPHRAQWLLAQAALRRRPPRFRAWRWLLLTLAALAVAVAHAAPRGQDTRGPTRLLVLLDGSASMGARGPAGEPFAQAVARLRSVLAAVPPQVDVEVVRLGDGVQRWSGAAARALATPGEPAGELPAPLAELAAQASDEHTAVWTLTDGQSGGLPSTGALTCLGGPTDNVALAVLEVHEHWPLPQLELDVELRNHGAPVTATLLVAGPVAAVPPQTFTLAANARRRVPLALLRTAAAGRLELRVAAAGDALASDDAWAADLPALPAPHIAVLADDRGATYMRVAAEALAEEVGGTVVDATTGASASYLLCEGGSAPLQPGRVAMAAFGVSPPGQQAVVWPAPTIVDWDRTEPLLQGLDLSELTVQHALAEALPAGKPLLLASRGAGPPQPLAVVVDGERASSLHFAFRLQDSNLPLLPAFPQLLRRAFLRGFGKAAGTIVRVSPSPPAESELSAPARAADRPLPDFGLPGADLAPTCLLAGLLLLATRACLR